MRKLLTILIGIALTTPCVSYAAGSMSSQSAAVTAEEEEYSSLDEALNASASQGKLAGEMDMEAPFVDNDSGGLGGEIGDTIDAQSEMEDDNYVGSDN